MTRRSVRELPPFAVISDLHANLDALVAVMDDIARRGVKHIVCLGDVVGYGPDPVECWRLVKEKCRLILKGNHDLEMAEGGLQRFHPRAKSAIAWTRKRILEEPDGREIIADIAALPPRIVEGRITYVHGSPAGPTLDYLLPGDAFDKERMRREFSRIDSYAFNGHSHIPGVIERDRAFAPPEALADSTYEMIGKAAIINVGSVGQPRDGNPRSCYVTVIEGKVAYHRVAYDPVPVCERIFEHPELDPFLGKRLLVGQ